MKPSEQQLEPIIGKSYRINAGEEYEETCKVIHIGSLDGLGRIVSFADGTYMRVVDWRSGVAAKEIVGV